MNCEKCIHYDVCDYLPCETINLLDDMERRCEYIKDKSKFKEVVHGEWIEGHYGIECSNCGREAVYHEGDDGRWHYEYYCPRCGADMRGEHNDI